MQQNVYGYEILECPTPTYFLNEDTHKIVKVSCNSWKCPVCCKKKASKLQRKAIIASMHKEIDNPHTRFLTLTLEDRDQEEIMMRDLNNLLTQLRTDGYIDAYFWVKEFTPSSHPYTDDYGNIRMSEGERRHIHLVWWGRYIPWQKVLKHWKHGSKLKKVGGRSPIRYLIKYLGSDQIQEIFDKGERRYSSSQNFFEKKKIKSGGRWIIWGSWMEGYKDISLSYEQQKNDKVRFELKYKVPDIHLEYQKNLSEKLSRKT